MYRLLLKYEGTNCYCQVLKCCNSLQRTPAKTNKNKIKQQQQKNKPTKPKGKNTTLA